MFKEYAVAFLFVSAIFNVILCALVFTHRCQERKKWITFEREGTSMKCLMPKTGSFGVRLDNDFVYTQVTIETEE